MFSFHLDLLSILLVDQKNGGRPNKTDGCSNLRSYLVIFFSTLCIEILEGHSFLVSVVNSKETEVKQSEMINI